MVEPRHPRLRERSPEDEAFLRELDAPPKKRRPSPSRAGRVVDALGTLVGYGLIVIVVVASAIIIASFLDSRESWLGAPAQEEQPLPTAEISSPAGQPAAPAQHVQVGPAPPAPSLNDPNTPAHGEQGGRPNEREAPPQQVQSIPPPSFGGRTNDHAPAAEVQSALPPSMGGRPNDHAEPTLGGKKKD